MLLAEEKKTKATVNRWASAGMFDALRWTEQSVRSMYSTYKCTLVKWLGLISMMVFGNIITYGMGKPGLQKIYVHLLRPFSPPVLTSGKRNSQREYESYEVVWQANYEERLEAKKKKLINMYVKKST